MANVSVTLSVRARARRRDARDVHACSVRLRTHGGGDVLVSCLMPEREDAVVGAFRGARRELLRRARNDRLGALMWTASPVAVPA